MIVLFVGLCTGVQAHLQIQTQNKPTELIKINCINAHSLWRYPPSMMQQYKFRPFKGTTSCTNKSKHLFQQKYCVISEPAEVYSDILSRFSQILRYNIYTRFICEFICPEAGWKYTNMEQPTLDKPVSKSHLNTISIFSGMEYQRNTFRSRKHTPGTAIQSHLTLGSR